MLEGIVWTCMVAGTVAVAELGRSNIRDWRQRRRARRRGRTLTAKYGIPWR